MDFQSVCHKSLTATDKTCNTSCNNFYSCSDECNGITCSCDVNWEGTACDKKCRTSLVAYSDVADSSLREGIPVNISCSSANQTGNFYWSRDHHCFNSSCNISANGTLYFEKLNKSDAGVYYCFNNNNYCTSRLNYTLALSKIVVCCNRCWYIGTYKCVESMDCLFVCWQAENLHFMFNDMKDCRCNLPNHVIEHAVLNASHCYQIIQLLI
ncbi:hypothetical protein HELRODRAFT_162303 [Helobdella robusta]|uniref:Ig-like domain-containing protein n=1 Tax=Helobdella robusta TaxID=6412 RepID=T1ESH2_HELRO|nr:hypothetical protein HELRODRAFT_162303 [Helobdella robusta]ESN98843.1 hypothetical protein HELRODRAFT_162303 [Helobdella robusta]